jgi:hypothetical protein
MSIPIEKCEERKIYKIDSRNLNIAVYCGEGAFIGIRTKFGDEFLFTEFHRDMGPPFGTVTCISDTGIVLPRRIKTDEHLGIMDTNTKRFVYYKTTSKGNMWDFCRRLNIDDEEAKKNIKPISLRNDALFDFLDDIRKKV